MCPIQRRLTPEQRKSITEGLSRADFNAKTPTLQLEYSTSDEESRIYALDFKNAIKAAGWNVSPLSGSMTGGLPEGVSVQFWKGIIEPAAAVILAEVLQRAEISFQRMTTIAVPAESCRLIIGPSH